MKFTRIFVLLLVSLIALSAWAGKKSVSYNVMLNGNKAVVAKTVKSVKGVKSVKIDAKTGVVDVFYDDSETNISTISNAFRTAGVYAVSIGENCATKPGGCLNNAPTSTNTMR